MAALRLKASIKADSYKALEFVIYRTSTPSVYLVSIFIDYNLVLLFKIYNFYRYKHYYILVDILFGVFGKNKRQVYHHIWIEESN